MKKIITIITLTLLIGCNITTTFADTWSEYKNGVQYSVTSDFIIVNDTALINLRDFVTNFSDNEISIDWNENTKTAVLTDGSHRSITISANKKEFYVDYINGFYEGERFVIELTQPAEIIDGHFYLPLRKVGEIYGLDFVWDPETKLIYIYS